MARVFTATDELDPDWSEFWDLKIDPKGDFDIRVGGRTSAYAYCYDDSGTQLFDFSLYKYFSAQQEGWIQWDLQLVNRDEYPEGPSLVGTSFYIYGEGGDPIEIRLNGEDPSLVVFWGTTEWNLGSFPRAVWKCIELHWYAGQETVEDDLLQIRIEGEILLNFSGIANRVLWPGGGANRFRWREWGAGTPWIFRRLNDLVDNLALNDPVGAADNSWLGDLRMYPLSPDEDVVSNWIRGGVDSGSQHGQVDEWWGNSGTDYLYIASGGVIETFRVPNLPATIDTYDFSVPRIFIAALHEVSTTDGVGIRLRLEAQESGLQVGSASWDYCHHEFPISGIDPGDDFTIGLESV